MKKYDRLQRIIEERCLLLDAAITLSAGARSSFYFDCKKVTLHGEGLALIADAILDTINAMPERPDVIGGLALGADPIVAAVVARAYQLGQQPIEGAIVRKEPKKHGTKSRIENQHPPGTRIVVVDDVITTGTSVRKACEEFISAGYIIVGIIALIDRKEGGKEKLESDFGAVVALFDRDDFLCENAPSRSPGR